jgi:hypothetical protein
VRRTIVEAVAETDDALGGMPAQDGSQQREAGARVVGRQERTVAIEAGALFEVKIGDDEGTPFRPEEGAGRIGGQRRAIQAQADRTRVVRWHDRQFDRIMAPPAPPQNTGADEDIRETMPADADKHPADPGPRRVGPVEPDLLGSAIFLYAEHLAAREADALPADEDDDEPKPQEVDMRAVLDLIAGELGTEVTTTLNLYMRLTALHRLLGAHPGLASIALDEDVPGGFLTEDALIAAARLELIVRGVGDARRAEFDFREFRTALDGTADE